MMRIYFALILFFATSIVFSQYSISGKITDCQNNKAIANASVEIQGIQKQTISDNEGNFTFTNLPKGKYLYYVTKDGFKGTFHSVSLKENKTRRNSRLAVLPRIRLASAVSCTPGSSTTIRLAP